jgi:HPt (histidine-containing phosphotransfer) domain-containing protein
MSFLRKAHAMAAAQRAIDIDHLNQYTGGDRDLNEEILRLFAQQCRAMVARLEELAQIEGAGGKSWHEAAHTLKGAARGVGAFALADIAAEAETVAGNKIAAAAVIERLKNTSAIVHRFIESLLDAG